MKRIVTGALAFILCFAILTALERGLVMLIDGRAEKESPLLTGYLTDELKESDRAGTMLRLIMYSNLGDSYDVKLADGSWFMDEDAVIVTLIDQSDDDEDGSNLYYMFHNDEMMTDYRSYTSQSKHEYMIKPQDGGEYNDSFTFYELVIDEFYIDGETLIPAKYSIYMVSDNEDGDGVFAVSYEKSEEPALPEMSPDAKHFLIQDNPLYKMSGNAVNKLAYKEEQDENEYSVFISVFKERDYSIEERRNRMENAFLGKSVKRDMTGFRQFYNETQPVNSELFGEGATIVVSRRNVLYRTYGLTSVIVIAVLAANTVISAVAALLVSLKAKRK